MNLSIYYQNLRGFHWNIKGSNFFELHLKFEELYTDALTKIDEVAERVLTLGHTPLHTFSDYVKTASIKELRNVSGDKESVTATIEALSTLIILERKALSLAQEAGDEGTGTFLSDYIMQHEKLSWMLTSWMGDR